jgi:hypothetical protein
MENQAVTVQLGARGTIVFRKGAVAETVTLEQSDIDEIAFDERVQSELDTIERLIEQLDAIGIRSREAGRVRARRP